MMLSFFEALVWGPVGMPFKKNWDFGCFKIVSDVILEVKSCLELLLGGREGKLGCLGGRSFPLE